METKQTMRNLTDLLEIVPCSRSHLYQAARRGDIPCVTIGQRLFVPQWYFDSIVNAGRGGAHDSGNQ